MITKNNNSNKRDKNWIYKSFFSGKQIKFSIDYLLLYFKGGLAGIIAKFGKFKKRRYLNII
jgi:hypothetical protein